MPQNPNANNWKKYLTIYHSDVEHMEKANIKFNNYAFILGIELINGRGLIPKFITLLNLMEAPVSADENMIIINKSMK